MMTPTEPEPGSLVGLWLVLDRMDWGNYGVVFRAQRAGHPESPPVALKMARHPLDPRFEREGQLLQGVPHPNIPRFEDSGVWTSPEGHRYPYVVMELVEGFTLYDWFRERQRSSRQVLAVLQQLASALAAAHARGAVHRDVKGHNIRVTLAGRVVLLDWGSCWFAGARPLTDTTAPPGTNPYRPPEQRLFIWRFRKDLEARWHAQPSDDLYALGVTLYRLVTGVYLPPRTEGGEPVERDVLPPRAMVTVCRELEALILRLIDEDWHARGSAEKLIREVDEVVQKAGPEADKPILPTARPAPKTGRCCSSDGRQDEEVVSDTDEPMEPSGTPPKRVERSPRSEPVTSPWLSLVGVVVVGCMLVYLGWEMHRTATEQQLAPQPWIATPEEMAQFAPDAGVGEETLSAAPDAPRAVLPSILSFGRPMPPKPYPGQRRPPCVRGERELIGACWLGPMEGQQPPCGDRMFDHEGKCYFASFDQDRQPTSNPP